MELPRLTYAIHAAGTPEAPAIYLVDSRAHPLALPIQAKRSVSIVHVFVPSWNDDLTPWSVPGLRAADPPFGSGAAATLDALVRFIVPGAEGGAGLYPRSRAIAGYSLAGLFALYAFVQPGEAVFDAAASLSGSLWYDGWTPYLEATPWNGTGRYAYLSLGAREKRTANPRMHNVENATQRTVELLAAKGCQVTYAPGPGNHFEHTQERLAAGIQALAEFWGA